VAGTRTTAHRESPKKTKGKNFKGQRRSQDGGNISSGELGTNQNRVIVGRHKVGVEKGGLIARRERRRS